MTFDESESDSSACCQEPTGPNTPSPGGAEPGPGGGKVGAVLVSPFVAPGSTSTQAYNHYSLLRSVEDLFGLPHLGYAAASGLTAFGPDVYRVHPPRRTVRRCRVVSLRGRPRNLPRGALITHVRVAHLRGGRRVLSVQGRHRLRLTVRAGRVRVIRSVLPCRVTRIRLSARARGPIRLTASAGRHVERRRLRD